MSCLFVDILIQAVWLAVDHRQQATQKWRAREVDGRPLAEEAQGAVGMSSLTSVNTA